MFAAGAAHLRPDLTAVDLRGLRLTALGPLAPFALVRTLDVSGNQLRSLAGAAALPRLEVLRARGNGLRALDLPPGSATRLQTLELADNPLATAESVVAALRGRAALQVLVLAGTPLAADAAGIQAVRDALPNLRELHV